MARKNKSPMETPQFWSEGVDFSSNTLLLSGAVDQEMVLRVTRFYRSIPADAESHLLLSSDGGEFESGIVIWDIIKGREAVVTITVVDTAHSMAFILLQAADVRRALPHSSLMHHVGSEEYPSSHPRNIRALIAFNDKRDREINQFIVDRVNATNKTVLTLNAWQKMDQWDNYMTAAEALAIGFLDEVVGSI